MLWQAFFIASLTLLGACSQTRLIGAERADGETFGAGGASSVSSSGSGIITPTPLGPIDPAAAARVAIALRSCGSVDPIEVILDRFYTRIGGPDDAIGRLAGAIACIDATAKGCVGVKECLGLFKDQNLVCSSGCEDTSLSTCDGTAEVDIDCAKLGLTCSPKAGRCLAVPLGPSCDQALFANTCTGSVPEGCLTTVVHGPNCAPLGLNCGFVTGAVNALCLGEGPACDLPVEQMSFYAVRLDAGLACDGGTLRTCVNRFEHAVDCASRGVGFTCQAGAPGAFFCGLATECTPGSEPILCDHDKGAITVCNAGRLDVVSCLDLGFSGGCDEKQGCLLPP